MKPTPPAPVGTLPIDPRTGGVISPIVAAALCIKPRSLLTRRQAEKVDVLKQTLPIFACMRSLAMRFRGLLRANTPDQLDDWIRDGCSSGRPQRPPDAASSKMRRQPAAWSARACMMLVWWSRFETRA